MKYGTIIACDDNEAILTALQFALEETFERIITLDSPERLLPTMASEHTDLVLLDMNFSFGANTGHEGLIWLQRLREAHPDVPVVLLTAYGDVPLAVRGMQQGASDFITKPWDNNELVSDLCAIIDAQGNVAPLEEVERRHIRRAVDRADGNLSVAAKMLGVTRQTLYNKLNKK